MHVDCSIHETFNGLLIFPLVYALVIRASWAKRVIFIQWDLSASMLVTLHVKVSEHLVNIVCLVHTQCPFLAVTGYSNAKDFLCLPQVLDLE